MVRDADALDKLLGPSIVHRHAMVVCPTSTAIQLHENARKSPASLTAQALCPGPLARRGGLGPWVECSLSVSTGVRESVSPTAQLDTPEPEEPPLLPEPPNNRSSTP